jgi:hypothetical protein
VYSSIGRLDQQGVDFQHLLVRLDWLILAQSLYQHYTTCLLKYIYFLELSLKIPHNGSGRITVSLQGKLVEMEARSLDPQEILTGSTVIIKEVTNNIAVVERV